MTSSASLSLRDCPAERVRVASWGNLHSYGSGEARSGRGRVRGGQGTWSAQTGVPGPRPPGGAGIRHLRVSWMARSVGGSTTPPQGRNGTGCGVPSDMSAVDGFGCGGRGPAAGSVFRTEPLGPMMSDDARCPLCDAEVHVHYTIPERGPGATYHRPVPSGEGTCHGRERHRLQRDADGISWSPR